jgi:hypothetical protein
MNKENKLGQAIILILVFPIVLLMLLFLLFYTPIDFFRYLFSGFRKDMKRVWGKRARYFWLVTIATHYKLYNLIAKNNLPIRFLPQDNNACEGGFVYSNKILFEEYVLPHYNSEKDEWYLTHGHHEEENLISYVEWKKAHFHECMAHNENVKCENVVFLVEERAVSSEEKNLYENADFILMYNKKNFAEKIREFLEKCGREN